MASRDVASSRLSVTSGAMSASALRSHTEPVQTPWAPRAMAAAIWRPSPIPPAASTGTRGADRVHDLGDQHHGGDLAAMATGFGALGHDHVDADRQLALGVLLRADQGADQQAVGVGLVDHVLGRRAEGVDDHADAGVADGHLHLAGPFGIDIEARPPSGPGARNRPGTAGSRPRGDPGDKLPMAVGDQALQVLGGGLLAAAGAT